MQGNFPDLKDIFPYFIKRGHQIYKVSAKDATVRFQNLGAKQKILIFYRQKRKGV